MGSVTGSALGDVGTVFALALVWCLMLWLMEQTYELIRHWLGR